MGRGGYLAGVFEKIFFQVHLLLGNAAGLQYVLTGNDVVGYVGFEGHPRTAIEQEEPDLEMRCYGGLKHIILERSKCLPW